VGVAAGSVAAGSTGAGWSCPEAGVNVASATDGGVAVGETDVVSTGAVQAASKIRNNAAARGRNMALSMAQESNFGNLRLADQPVIFARQPLHHAPISSTPDPDTSA